MAEHKPNEDQTPDVNQKDVTESENTPLLKDSGKKAVQGYEPSYVPMPDELRMDLYEIEKLPPEQRGTAFGEYFNKSSAQDLLQMNGHSDQYQTKIFDSKTGKFIIVRDDTKKTDE
jgi:hypothetical protein